jgi:MHS family alpha-ketoglutarate permease-like MFS transporter
VTIAIFVSLLVYIFALKNKKPTHLDDEQGSAFVSSGSARLADAARDNRDGDLTKV